MKSKIVRWLSLVVVVVVLAALSFSSIASAASPAQNGTRLENLYKREQLVLADQQTRLNLSNQAIAAAQTWINDLSSEGKDVSAVQAALAKFQSGVSDAQNYFNTAQSVLNAHDGFDGSSKATNMVQALKTVVDAGRAEVQFHLKITQATLDFRLAVRQYLQVQ